MPPLPSVSVIIPTYNRPEAIVRCLASFRRVDYPRDRFEIIVVDDGGQVPLDPLVRPFAGELKIRLLRRANGGPGAARNTGVAASQSDILAFTDDDCFPHPVWLRAIAAALRRHPTALVGGPVVNLLRKNPYAEASQQLVGFLCSYYNRVPLRAKFFTGNNIAARRQDFLAMGGFDERFERAAAEDREFCHRWHRSGRPVVGAPKAIVGHRHPLTLRRYLRQHWNYGRGAWKYRANVAERLGDSVRVEPPSFYRDLLLYPVRQPGGLPWRAVILSLFLLSQVANAAGFFAEALTNPGARRRGRR